MNKKNLMQALAIAALLINGPGMVASATAAPRPANPTLKTAANGQLHALDSHSDRTHESAFFVCPIFPDLPFCS